MKLFGKIMEFDNLLIHLHAKRTESITVHYSRSVEQRGGSDHHSNNTS